MPPNTENRPKSVIPNANNAKRVVSNEQIVEIPNFTYIIIEFIAMDLFVFSSISKNIIWSYLLGVIQSFIANLTSGPFHGLGLGNGDYLDAICNSVA